MPRPKSIREKCSVCGNPKPVYNSDLCNPCKHKRAKETNIKRAQEKKAAQEKNKPKGRRQKTMWWEKAPPSPGFSICNDGRFDYKSRRWIIIPEGGSNVIPG